MGKNNLLKRIGLSALPFVIGFSSLINGGCTIFYEENLKVGESEISYNLYKYPFERSWDVMEEKKDGTRIYYDVKPNLHCYDIQPDPYGNPKIFKLKRLKINNEFYDERDRAFFLKAEEKIQYLIERYYFMIDSIRQAKDPRRQTNGLKAFD